MVLTILSADVKILPMKIAWTVLLLAAVALPLMGQTCPLGVTDDPHPGQCGAYRDSDRDSICDLSQASAATSSGAVTGRPAGPAHHAWQIFLAAGLLGVVTEIAIRRKKELSFRLQTAWNWLLLLFFALSSLTGLFFLLPPTARPALGLDMPYWHTETGLAFIAVGVYHALRRMACMLRGLGACFPRR